MFVLYHPGYVADIGPQHRFPMQKYGLALPALASGACRGLRRRAGAIGAAIGQRRPTVLRHLQ